MKVVFGLLVVLGLGCGAVYYLGGYGSWDPSEQGREKRSQIQPGMSYAKVFDDVTGNPRKYRIINLKKHRAHGEEIEELVPSAEVNFDRARVDDHIRNNTLPHGFMCTFNYSQSVAFSVTFDGSGTVLGVNDAMTMADLLQMPKKSAAPAQDTADEEGEVADETPEAAPGD